MSYVDYAITYSDLRRALVAPDDMSRTQLMMLAMRCDEAATKYPDATGTPAQNAMNKVLRAYAEYIEATMVERA